MSPVMQALIGSWFVCGTTFPMWLKGTKTNPTFTYTAVERKGQWVLLDQVKYLQKGKAKTLTGYDYPSPADPAAFEWRGKGLLSLVRSQWSVRLQDPDGQWAVIWFSKTLFTPEGVDIISRQPHLPDVTRHHIKALMANQSPLARHLPYLRDLSVQPAP